MRQAIFWISEESVRWHIHAAPGEQELDDNVIKWKHFPRYWPFRWVNNGKAGDLRRHRAHYDVIVMSWDPGPITQTMFLWKFKFNENIVVSADILAIRISVFECS